jgi:hypothetical protein
LRKNKHKSSEKTITAFIQELETATTHFWQKMSMQRNTLPKAIICDLDGTLALFGKANPYERDFTKDELSNAVAQVLKWKVEAEHSATTPTALLLVSGRIDKYRDQTEDWLHSHNITYAKLFMRRDGDFRKDVVVKQEIYDREIREKYDVLFVLDDRDQVVKMWRRNGIVCFQVAEGNF